MLDWLIKNGTVVDGTGAAPHVADVGVRAGRIVAVGPISEPAQHTMDATGLWITPGFVDIHTHYDGQATWDACFTPSIYHGVTTLVMGNCGVGFAPKRTGHENDLIKLMEGVEDIPGAALHEGIRWNWESFPQYMDALAATPRSLDYLVQVPHDPLRMYVMGERALAHERATPEEIHAMQALLREALQAGAAGFSTGRSDNHRTSEGKDTPAANATADELRALAQAFEGLGHGVIQIVSDFNLLHGPAEFDVEFDVVELLAQASGKPVSLTWLQRDPGGEQYLKIQARVEAAVKAGLPLYLQTAVRGIGVLNGLEASFHPFMGFPSYKEVAQLPLAQRAEAMRDPARKARILSEKSERLAGDGSAIPPLVDILLSRIDMISGRMFPLEATLNYEPSVMDSFLVRAKQKGTGTPPMTNTRLSPWAIAGKNFCTIRLCAPSRLSVSMMLPRFSPSALTRKMPIPPMPSSGFKMMSWCSAWKARTACASRVTSVGPMCWGNSMMASFSGWSRRARGLLNTLAPSRSACSSICVA